MQKKNNKFNQLSQEEMIEIYILLRGWLSYRQIWLRLGRSHTTIAREVQRNSIDYWWWNMEYKPLVAYEKKKKRRKKANRRHVKLRKNDALRTKIYTILSDPNNCWWPDEILWYLKREWWEVVATSTLYNYIREYTDRSKYLRFQKEWYKYTRWKRKKTITIKDVPRIDKRSKRVNDREWDADREVDTVVDPGHVSWLFTCTNRKSRYEIIRFIPNHKSDTLLTVMTHALINEKVDTITSDNWSEFARLSTLWKRLKAKCFTAHPWASYERWTNEKHNWFIRWFIPKWIKSSEYSDEEIQHFQDMLNHKPRKILGYLTPHEVYHNTTMSYY